MWVKLYHDRVAIAVGAQVVAQHARAFARGAKVPNALRVLPLLERKHRAAAEATAFAHWRLAPVWQRVRAELARHPRKPDQEWVRMLRLMETHPAAAVERARPGRSRAPFIVPRDGAAAPPPAAEHPTVHLPAAHGIRPDLAEITVSCPTLAPYHALAESRY